MVLLIAVVVLIIFAFNYKHIINVKYDFSSDKLYLKHLLKTKVISISSIVEISECDCYEGTLPTISLGVFFLKPTYQFIILTENTRYKLSTRMTDKQLTELKERNPNIAIFVKPMWWFKLELCCGLFENKYYNYYIISLKWAFKNIKMISIIIYIRCSHIYLSIFI